MVYIFRARYGSILMNFAKNYVGVLFKKHLCQELHYYYNPKLIVIFSLPVDDF